MSRRRLRVASRLVLRSRRGRLDVWGHRPASFHLGHYQGTIKRRPPNLEDPRDVRSTMPFASALFGGVHSLRRQDVTSMRELQFNVQPCEKCGATTTLARCVQCEWIEARRPIMDRVTELIQQVTGETQTANCRQVPRTEYYAALSVRLGDAEALINWLAKTGEYFPIEAPSLQEQMAQTKALAEARGRCSPSNQPDEARGGRLRSCTRRGA